MTFDELLAVVCGDVPPGVRTDSRLVRPGDVFVAIAGSAADGHRFIDQAIANGAQYIVCQRPNHSSSSATTVVVENSARAAGLLAQASYGRPASKLTNLAVTGTNGKTTVAFLVHACITHAGKRCGLMGTVVYDTGSGVTPASLTTPDTLTVARMQHSMVEAGAEYM